MGIKERAKSLVQRKYKLRIKKIGFEMCIRDSLKGDENGCLSLTDELLRVFVINDRAGVYENRWDGKSE